MITGHYFKRIGAGRRTHATATRLAGGAFLAVLLDGVVERFARISGQTALAIPLDLPGLENAEDLPESPTHPVCAEFAETDYCRESWRLHLAEFGRQPQAHWHRCDYRRLCAVIPVVCQRRCLAAVKLACPDTMAEESFERNVEVLNVLVENLVATESGRLTRLLPPEQAGAELKVPPASQTNKPAGAGSNHRQVLAALKYVEDHLSDPKLTVGGIARALDIHPDYLAHLFARQLGQRMSRYITACRMELAQSLLATTDWQIKRVAREAGHANANWFSHVFSTHTGLTPSEHRRKARSQGQTGSGRGGDVPGRRVLCRSAVADG